MAKKLARKKSAAKAARRRRRAKAGRRPRRSGRQRRPRPRRRAKYVYFFGRKTDGNGSMKPLLGGKGANLAEMCRIGLPVPPGLHDHHRGLHLLLRQQADLSAGAAQAQMEARHRRARAADRQEVRRSEEPAARLGALRRARLDAGHDGHDPQPRPQRPDRRGAGDQDRQRRASPGTATAASSRCTATSCSACRSAPDEDHEPFETVIDGLKHERYHQDIEDTKLTVDDLQGAGASASRRWSRSASASSSRTRRGISCSAPSAPCSARG